MSSAATPAGSSSPTISGPSDPRVKAALESGVKFQIKAGNSKWQCTILDRAAHERQKAARSSSSASISTTDSGSSK